MSGITKQAIPTVDKREAFISHVRGNNAFEGLPGKKLRKEAESYLADLEIPTKKWEAWKYTSLADIVDAKYLPSSSPTLTNIDPFLIPNLEADVLVFVNGEYMPSLSEIQLGSPIQISSISSLPPHLLEVYERHVGKTLKSETNFFSALNAAYVHDGVFVRLPKNALAPRPVHIINVGDSHEGARAYQTRNLILAEQGSQATIIESQYSQGDSGGFLNQVTEIKVQENAKVEYIQLQLGGDHAKAITQTEVHQASNSNCSIFTLSFSGKRIRNNLKIRLKGENIESNLMGAYLLDGEQHLDNHTEVDHEQAHCYSNELYKGIIHGKATAVFNGKIHVFQDAQKTNAFQSNRNILLSDTANIYTKPQLEIYADDVKCSHGATTGRLDKEALFYLQARGIDKEEARKLLVHAFATEVSNHISIDHVKEFVAQRIEEKY